MDIYQELRNRQLEEPMTENQDLQSLIAEGRQLLEQGDKPRALAHFVTATQLHPEDVNLWLLRAEATDDPVEAAACLDRVLELDPDNAQAHDKMIFTQMHSLQERAREETKVIPQSKLGLRNGMLGSFRFWFITFTAFFCAASTFVVAGLYLFTQMQNVDASPAAGSNRAVPEVMAMPPTWTPQPTATPLPPFTPAPPPTWAIKRDVNMRGGPGIAYASLGTLKKGEQVFVTGQTKDGSYLQVQSTGQELPAWVPTDYVEISNTDRATVAVITALPAPPPTRGPIAPVAKPTNTPAPLFDFELYRPAVMLVDCTRQTGVSGMVYTSKSNPQPMSGVFVRVMAFGQVQSIVPTGVKGRPGYWEWNFANGMDIVGEVTVVGSDSSQRSAPINFHLLNCNQGSNHSMIDFVGAR